MADKNIKAVQQKLDSLPDPFLTGDDVHLDLSGFPQLDSRLLSDTSDPFLTGDDVHLVEEHRNTLRQGLLKLANSRDGEIAQHLRAAGIEDATASKSFFISSGEKATAYLKDGIWCVTCFHEDGTQETVKTTAETREAAQTQAAQYFARKTPATRPLTESEELYVTRLAQLGKIEDALMNYVFCRIGEQDRPIFDDPRFTSICNEAVWVVFIAANPRYTEAARPFMEDFLSGRDILNIPLLKAAFEAYETEHARAGLSLLPRNQVTEPTPEEINLEDLSDADIAQLKDSVTREYARQRQRR
jgi:hypothetical protein